MSSAISSTAKFSLPSDMSEKHWHTFEFAYATGTKREGLNLATHVLGKIYKDRAVVQIGIEDFDLLPKIFKEKIHQQFKTIGNNMINIDRLYIREDLPLLSRVDLNGDKAKSSVQQIGANDYFFPLVETLKFKIFYSKELTSEQLKLLDETTNFVKTWFPKNVKVEQKISKLPELDSCCFSPYFGAAIVLGVAFVAASYFKYFF